MKTCSQCKEKKPIEEFAKKGTRTQSFCKSCQASYRKKHYEQNKAYYIEKAKKWKAEFNKWFDSIKIGLSCELCGEDRHWVLDFHHNDPSKKESSVAKLKERCNKKKVLEEIERCTVLCSNCHRDLHYQERQASEA